jgi:hypothetical protein
MRLKVWNIHRAGKYSFVLILSSSDIVFALFCEISGSQGGKYEDDKTSGI